MATDTSIHQCSNTAAHSVSFILSHVLKPLTHCMSESESALCKTYNEFDTVAINVLTMTRSHYNM